MYRIAVLNSSRSCSRAKSSLSLRYGRSRLRSSLTRTLYIWPRTRPRMLLESSKNDGSMVSRKRQFASWSGFSCWRKLSMHEVFPDPRSPQKAMMLLVLRRSLLLSADNSRKMSCARSYWARNMDSSRFSVPSTITQLSSSLLNISLLCLSDTLSCTVCCEVVMLETMASGFFTVQQIYNFLLQRRGSFGKTCDPDGIFAYFCGKNRILP